MRLFTPFIFLPAIIALLGIAVFDRQRGDRDAERRAVMGIRGLGCLSNGCLGGYSVVFCLQTRLRRSSGLAGKEHLSR